MVTYPAACARALQFICMRFLYLPTKKQWTKQDLLNYRYKIAIAARRVQEGRTITLFGLALVVNRGLRGRGLSSSPTHSGLYMEI